MDTNTAASMQSDQVPTFEEVLEQLEQSDQQLEHAAYTLFQATSDLMSHYSKSVDSVNSEAVVEERIALNEAYIQTIDSLLQIAWMQVKRMQLLKQAQAQVQHQHPLPEFESGSGSDAIQQ